MTLHTAASIALFVVLLYAGLEALVAAVGRYVTAQGPNVSPSGDDDSRP